MVMMFVYAGELRTNTKAEKGLVSVTPYAKTRDSWR